MKACLSMDKEINETCKICNSSFSSESEFNRHFFKKHGITLKNYFESIIGKKDLLTGEKIPFKTKQQYYFQDFINRNNFKKWIKNQTPEIQKEYCRNLLIKRKEEKDLIWAPTEIENKTVKFIPSIAFFNNLFGDYYKLCEELGFKNKHQKIPDNFSFQLNKVEKEQFIIIDSREQTPINFSKVQIQKIDYGDYHFPAKSDIFIERKNLADFVGTLGNGFERFVKEIERAAANNHYLVVVVESNLSKSTSFEYSLWNYKINKMKVTADYIFHNVRDLLQRFNNLQFIFVDGREEFRKVVEILFTCTNNIKNIDLELLYELGKFNLKENDLLP